MATVVSQEFERGKMYWFEPSSPELCGTIFALTDTNQWWRGEDDWDGVSTPTVEAPPDLLTPGGGFGHAWQEQGFESVLGFATGSEQVTEGWHNAWGDGGWALHVGGHLIELEASDEWTPPEPEPEPTPEPEPGPTPSPTPVPMPGAVGSWVWLNGLDLPLNLAHVVWIGTDRLRIGSHDIVLSLPKQTATALRAFIKMKCIKAI